MASKTNLKQGTLFSFFNKAKVEAPVNKTEYESPQATKKDPANPLLSKLKIGDQIEVYWKDDDEYYAAKVTQQHQASYFLEYEDGQTEWLDLAQETFRIAPERRRRQIRDDDNDDEGEAEFDGCLESEDDGSVYEQKDDEQIQDDESEEDKWLVSDEEESEEEEDLRPKRKKFKVTKYKTPEVMQKTPSSSARKTTSSLGQFGHTPKSVTPSSSSKYSPLVVQTPSYSTPVFKTAASEDNKVTPFIKDAVNPAGNHVHNHLPFLQNPRDIHRRSKDDPNYDPRTLFVVEDDWIKIMGKSMTDAVKQWWDLKSQYFDTILLFKTGKSTNSSVHQKIVITLELICLVD